MIAAILPVLATASPALADTAYPVREVLAAFATACATAEDTQANMAEALAAGWERLPADADEPVSRMVRNERQVLLADTPDGEAISGGEYRQVVAGRTLFLTITGARAFGATSRSCRLYDFAAPRALTADELGQWATRPPGPADAYAGVTKFTWSPGLKPGHGDMQAIYVEPGMLRALPGFDAGGLALIASALEF